MNMNMNKIMMIMKVRVKILNNHYKKNYILKKRNHSFNLIYYIILFLKVNSLFN